MSGKFTLSGEVVREQPDWGELGWLSRPPATTAKHITMIEVTLNAGKGHDFHKHPDQEEVIYVVSGKIEQWLESEKRILGPGDSIFIAPDVVHASFNAGSEAAQLMVVLGPCVGDGGYEVVEVADQEPWNGLR